jgi:diacylglycerol O-acyltransferase / wax synthase
VADSLNALDATFLELEQLDEGATMHIGGVMVFDPLPDGGIPSLEAVCADTAARLARLPRYSQRLSSERTGGLAWPHWEEDRQFEIGNHIYRAALPKPGGEAELCEWASDYFSHRLDRTRPLWETALIEGLADGRWALATKTHHCLVDGVGSVGVAEVLLDTEPSPAERNLESPHPDGPARDWQSLLPNPPAAVSGLARTGAQATSAGIHAALHPREALERARALTEMVVRNELVSAPHSSLNLPIGATRRFEIVRASLGELKAIGRQFEASVNDVLLAACTAGLRRMLLSRGERIPSEGLRAMVPVNVRGVSEQLALGNRVSSLFVDLPVAEPDAVARLRAVVGHTRRLKSSDAGLGATTMIEVAGVAPPVMHALIARSLYATRLFNLTITNVPGPQIPLYAFGARLREVYPVVPLAAEHAIGIAIFSYDGGVVLGLSADRDSTPDLHVLAEGVGAGLQELREQTPKGAGGGVELEAGKKTRTAGKKARTAGKNARTAGTKHDGAVGRT